VRPRFQRWFVLAAALACACGAGHGHAEIPGRVSGPSPFLQGCGGDSQPGTLYMNAEVEPFLAVDPKDSRHLIGVWQQDRWSSGGANGLVSGVSFDGGSTWTRNAARFSRCSGGDYQRASDPWVSFGPDGTAWQIGLSFDGNGPNRAVLASRSGDGGRTWRDPVTLVRDTDPGLALDKESITADPHDPALVYAVWDRVTEVTQPNSPTARGPAWFSRTTDGGASWETARMIYDPGPDAQTISNQIVVLPDGVLVNLFDVIAGNSTSAPTTRAVVMRSTDKGVTWSTPIEVAKCLFVGSVDPKNSRPIRAGAVVPAIAADAASGTLYVAWHDARFSGGVRDGIALSRSLDGGMNWSPPMQVNQAPNVQAFTPALAMARSGRLGVSYYDLRNDVASDGSQLLVTRWLATTADGGASWHETALAPPFDLRTAPFAGGYFLGDYAGLVHDGDSFLSLFVMTTGDGANRTGVFLRSARD
jgi:hypothetical protein